MKYPILLLRNVPSEKRLTRIRVEPENLKASAPESAAVPEPGQPATSRVQAEVKMAAKLEIEPFAVKDCALAAIATGRRARRTCASCATTCWRCTSVVSTTISGVGCCVRTSTIPSTTTTSPRGCATPCTTRAWPSASASSIRPTTPTSSNFAGSWWTSSNSDSTKPSFSPGRGATSSSLPRPRSRLSCSTRASVSPPRGTRRRGPGAVARQHLLPLHRRAPPRTAGRG